jgi:hypothetical protein
MKAGTKGARREDVGFEVLIAVDVKSTTFRDMKPCSLLKPTEVPEKHTASIFKVE